MDSAVNLLRADGFNNYKIETVESKEPKDSVVELRIDDKVVKPNDKVDAGKLLTIYVSLGPGGQSLVTRDVVINLRNSAVEDSCFVRVTRNGVEVFNQEVAKGTLSITVPNQSGQGAQKYVVEIDELDSFDHWEEFS